MHYWASTSIGSSLIWWFLFVLSAVHTIPKCKFALWLAPGVFHIHWLILICVIMLVRNDDVFFAICMILVIHLAIPHVDVAICDGQLPAIGFERFNLCLGHFEDILSQVLYAFHDRLLPFRDFGIDLPREGRIVHLIGDERKFCRARQENIECWLQLEARFQDRSATQNVQTQSCTGQCDREAADVS